MDEVDRSIMQYVESYETWNKKKKVARPDDADTLKYYYTVSNRSVTVYRERVEASEDVEAKEAEERRKAEFNRREAALKKLAEDAYQLRLDFIKSYSKAKKNLPQILRFAGVAFCEYSDSADFEVLAELLDVPMDVENEGFDVEAYDAAMCERPEYTLLATVYAAADYEGQTYYRKNYRMENGQYDYHLDYEANEQLDFIYNRLTALGYEMSDEEKALRDGTHELFSEGDSTPQKEQEASQDE